VVHPPTEDGKPRFPDVEGSHRNVEESEAEREQRLVLSLEVGHNNNTTTK
jgi:hypothetical protein